MTETRERGPTGNYTVQVFAEVYVEDGVVTGIFVEPTLDVDFAHGVEVQHAGFDWRVDMNTGTVEKSDDDGWYDVEHDDEHVEEAVALARSVVYGSEFPAGDRESLWHWNRP